MGTNEPQRPEDRGYTEALDPSAAQLERWKAELLKDVEQYKATLAINLEQHKDHLKYANEFKIEAFKATIGFAQTAIRGLVLINGGAAVALLTFLANVWSPDEPMMAQAAHAG